MAPGPLTPDQWPHSLVGQSLPPSPGRHAKQLHERCSTGLRHGQGCFQRHCLTAIVWHTIMHDA